MYTLVKSGYSSSSSTFGLFFMSVLNFSQFSAIVNFLFLPHFLWFGHKWRIEELQLRAVQVAQPLRMYRAKKKKKKKKGKPMGTTDVYPSKAPRHLCTANERNETPSLVSEEESKERDIVKRCKIEEMIQAHIH